MFVKKSSLLLTILIFCTNSADIFNLTPQAKNILLRASIAVSALGAGLTCGVAVGARHSKAALECKKMDQELEKERVKKAAEDEQRAQELKKQEAVAFVANLHGEYKDEFDLHKAGRLNERYAEPFSKIIRSKYNHLPYNEYHKTITHHIHTLQQQTLPAEHVQAQQAALTLLKAALKAFNYSFAEQQRAESEKYHAQKEMQEAKQRQVEREVLENKKLHAQVTDSAIIKETLTAIRQSMRAFGEKLDTHTILANTVTAKTGSAIEDVQAKLAQQHQELKRAAEQNNRTLTSVLEAMQTQFKDVILLMKNLISSPSPVSHHPTPSVPATSQEAPPATYASGTPDGIQPIPVTT